MKDKELNQRARRINSERLVPDDPLELLHSLFRQGCMLYELIPNMPEHRLAPLIAAFAQAVSQASAFGNLLA